MTISALHFPLLRFGLAVLLMSSVLRAQARVPTLKGPIPDQTMSLGRPITLDLRDYFSVPGVVGTKFVIFDTVMGRFSVELRDDAAPRHVANFLTYVEAGDYTNSIFDHAPRFPSGGGANASIIVGGSSLPSGWSNSASVSGWIRPRHDSVSAEYMLDNARGTLSAARTQEFSLGGDSPYPLVGEATSAWFFNVNDNTRQLGPAGGFGYTVFGRIFGTGVSVVDAIAALPMLNMNWLNDPYGLGGSFPVRNGFAGSGAPLSPDYMVVVNSISPATLFPTGEGLSVNDLTVQNSAPAVVRTNVSATTLTLSPVAAGTSDITVRMIDTNGNAAEDTFRVRVSSGPPVFMSHPLSKTVTTGSTVVFGSSAANAAIYRWEHNGIPIPNATTDTLVIQNVTSAHAGPYMNVATNDVGTVVQSHAAILTTIDLPPAFVGRLINLSVLAAAGSGARMLTMGAIVGGGNTEGLLPLIVRAVGPTLAQPPFNVLGVLADPVLTLYRDDNATPIDSNDNWGGSASVATAFRLAGAFDLPAASLDSAIVHTVPASRAGGYIVQVAGKGEGNGTVMAEIYDATGSARTAATPRLINGSVRGRIDPGSALTLGFAVGGGSARTVLVRGVGPSLAGFGVAGWMANPRVELFANDNGQPVAFNDDWGGNNDVAKVTAAVGAFPLAGGLSNDALLLLTLSPGSYSVRMSGVGGTGGAALIEIYEVP